MQNNYDDIMTYAPAEISSNAVTIDKIEENSQVTVTDTGWSEEEKERMKAYGYDSLDMVRAWHS